MHARSPQKGFAHLFLLLFIIVLAGVGFAGWLVWKQQAKDSDGAMDTGWQDGCSGDQRVAMAHSPMDMDDVESVLPLGLTAGAHVTPIDHLYFYPKDSSRDQFPVYAMADGNIIEISVRAVNVDSGETRPPEYRVIMQHSCQTISYFDLVTKLDDEIVQAYPKVMTEGMTGRFPIKAGQEIGRIGAQSLDTAVYNLDLVLPGFTHPEMYRVEPWKVHTDDFFSYFSGAIKDAMLAKNPRVAEPRSGKIDYDQPGKLIGNWFKQDTNGYTGLRDKGAVGDSGVGYWTTHLAVFPFAIDPSQIIVSLGDYKDHQPQAFGVRGNAPNPATVDVATGVVKYELVQIPQGIGSSIINEATAPSRGTALFQVLDGEKIKFELFADRTPREVTGFSSRAAVYER